MSIPHGWEDGGGFQAAVEENGAACLMDGVGGRKRGDILAWPNGLYVPSHL
jgi:hypothetical protein